MHGRMLISNTPERRMTAEDGICIYDGTCASGQPRYHPSSPRDRSQGGIRCLFGTSRRFVTCVVGVAISSFIRISFHGVEQVPPTSRSCTVPSIAPCSAIEDHPILNGPHNDRRRRLPALFLAAARTRVLWHRYERSAGFSARHSWRHHLPRVDASWPKVHRSGIRWRCQTTSIFRGPQAAAVDPGP